MLKAGKNLKVEQVAVFDGHTDCIYDLKWGKSNEIFYSASGDGLVAQWNINNPTEGKAIARSSHAVYAIHYDEQNDEIIIGANRNGLHFVTLRSGEPQLEANCEINDEPIFFIELINGLIWVGTGKGHVYLVDHDRRQVIGQFQTSQSSARCCCYLTALQQIVIGYSDGTISRYALDGTLIDSTVAHDNSVFTMACHNSQLISGGRDAAINVWNISNEEGLSLEKHIPAHYFAVNKLIFRDDFKYFISCSMDKSIKVWDAQTHRLIKVIDKERHAGHATSVNTLLWQASNHQIIAAGDDKKITSWFLKNVT